MKKEDLHIIQVGDVLVSPDIFTEKFCCDLDKCHGICCVEGDAGAPISMDEIAETEAVLDVVWPDLKASAQAVIDKQGVAYVDEEGDLVTSIVGGKDCVFTYDHEGCCLCALEKAYRGGRTQFKKPISLEPMNPYERRIIHSVLQSDSFVSTRSDGDEPFRYITVIPRYNKRNNYRKYNNNLNK